MHSGYEIPGIQQHQQAAENNTYAPVLLSMNQTHILDQIHTLPASQQRLFLEQPHFLPPQSHHFVGSASSPAYFPAAANFKLGLNNEICTRNNNNNDYTNKDSSNIDVARGSEQYEVPDVRQSSLGMVHCWQNQQDSAIKQPPPPLWEHQVSNENNQNSEIVSQEMNNKENRVHFGELEAIYNQRLPEPPEEEEASEAAPPPPPKPNNGGNYNKRKKKSKDNSYSQVLISPTAEFFGDLVKQVMDHQEKMHKKFAEVIERLEDERKAREEDWRRREMERFEQESEARAKEKASAKDREAMIVSYLERITGERVAISEFDPMDIVPTNT